jgi:hypothetical protein
MSLPTDLPVGFNLTLANNTDLCTLQTCPLSLAHVQYVPNLGGNLLYVAIFGLALVAQIGLAIRCKTWGFGGAMFGGLVLEVIGYVARVQIHSNPFKKNPFLMYVFWLPEQTSSNPRPGISCVSQSDLHFLQQQSISVCHVSLSPTRKAYLESDLQHTQWSSLLATLLPFSFRLLVEL